MPNDKIKEKINLIKNIGKTFESIRVNSTNLLPEIWDRDNSIKKKVEQTWSQGPNNQMWNDEFEKKINFNKQPKKRPNLIELKSWDKNYPIGRQSWKNDKVKFPTVKQFKTKKIWIKYGIKTKQNKIIRG
jgi:hypothetical protein